MLYLKRGICALYRWLIYVNNIFIRKTSKDVFFLLVGRCGNKSCGSLVL